LDKPPERGVDPMECVAIGAAVQGAVIAGDIKDIVLLDVTPLSLGVETLGQVFTQVIEKNTTIPTKRSQIFTTAADFQTSVTVHVLQGERPMAADNVSLGQFNLVDIPPAPRGVPQIEVTFDIDVNGILNVTAKDLGTGKEQKITITASKKLSKEEIDRMIKDADKFADQDKVKKEEAELRNQVESLIYTAEKTKTDLKDKITSDQITKIDQAVKETKEVLSSKDFNKLKEKSKELEKILQDIGTAVYQKAAQESAKTQPPPSNKKAPKDKEKVIDAEYEVDEEKKQ
jgi:molecular chaperone DnaK